MVKKFTWSEFPTKFLKAVVYSDKTPKALRPQVEYDDNTLLTVYMDEICLYPYDGFVKKYKAEIDNYFFADSNRLVSVCKRFEKLNYGGIKVTNNEDMLMKIRQKRCTSTLCQCYVRELLLYGKKNDGDDESLFKGEKVIDLQLAEKEEIAMFPYQKKAIEKLKAYFVDEDKQSGILVMPTGSGKTRTSVYFLLQDMISNGYQVIWLTHRAMLIEQTANTFYRLSPLIKDNNEDMEEFKMVCISGQHSNVKIMEEDDNLIISSVQSLCNNTEYLPNILGEKVVIVVDEAHHTIAPSYRRIIDKIREYCPWSKLLGITATPVRLTDKGTLRLMKLFDNTIIYSKSMSELIADGTLAKPEYIPVETNVDIEAFIDIDERKYINKWGEMPESLLEKVAKTNERNSVIVDEYIKNKDVYGKTIIFALNGIHCVALDDEFKRRGIRSEYIYTHNKNNVEVIERFRNNKAENGVDVLININMLTEGSDIPDINTVFLTRPTSSDTLLMQMVGRGMRGSACGGTDTVKIVDFCDKWTSITKWFNPKFLFTEEEMADEPIEVGEREQFSLVPVDMIRDMIKGISYTGDRAISKGKVLPTGWFDVFDEDGNDVKVLVFANQLDGYKKLHQYRKLYAENKNLTGRYVLEKYFMGLYGGIPKEKELDYIIDYIRKDKDNLMPTFHSFAEKNEIDPYIVTKKIKKEDIKFSEIQSKIKEICEKYEKLIVSLYGSVEYYKQRIFDFLMYEDGMIPLGTKIEEVEKKTYKFSDEPLNQSIDELLDEVIKEQGKKLKEGFVRPEIYWTDRNYASYFGVYYHDENVIQINRLLNSQSVPKEAVKFVIYHECLHQGIAGHPKEFRALERKYPKFQKWERFLTYELSDFDFETAM